MPSSGSGDYKPCSKLFLAPTAHSTEEKVAAGPGRGDGRVDGSFAALRVPVVRTTGGDRRLSGGRASPRGAHRRRFIKFGGGSPYFPMRRVDVDGAPRRLLDGALVANNPTQFALAEAAALRRRKNRNKAVGKEDAQLDLVVSLGTGSAPARATSSSGAEVLGLLSALANLAAARDFVSGIIDLLTDTDATHDLVRRQLRDTWPSLIQERYHRLGDVVDARHLGLAEGDAECRGTCGRWRSTTSSASEGSSGATSSAAQKRRAAAARGVRAVVDLDEESMRVAEAPPRGAPAARAEEVRARDGIAPASSRRRGGGVNNKFQTSHDEHAVDRPQRRPQAAADEEVRRAAGAGMRAMGPDAVVRVVALERHDARLPHRRLELRPVPGLDAKRPALVVVQLDARRRRPPEGVPALGHAREARQADALERDVFQQTLDGLEGVVLGQGPLEAQAEAFQRPGRVL